MTDDDLLSSATAALREASVEGDGAATRLRIRRSLEADHRGRRQLVSFATATSIVLAGGMSWAFATGRAAEVWHAIVDPAPVGEVREVREEPAPMPAPRAVSGPVGSAHKQKQESPQPQEQQAVPEVQDLGPVEETPVPTPVPAPTPAPAPPRATASAPTPTLAPTPRATAPARLATVRPPIEALYSKAHELHFRGTDHVAAIAAWDAYLAAEPNGRFVAEARYNRALLLIRVGRYAEARAALEPYARGEVATGYRRAEAAQLVERLPASP